MEERGDDVKFIITNRAVGKMIDKAATEVHVRDLKPFISDEKPDGGGKNRGPSPLEMVLGALCA
jgi:uncharacterized OsmC-like protein